MGMLGERLEYASVEARLLPWSPEGGRRVLDDFIEYERRTRFTGEYLTKVDGGTMYHALEARSPFLDQDVWNFASALPYSLRLRGGRLKAILREIARRRIGERVASGEKRGFGIPVQRWITGRWRAAVQETFAQSLLARDGWIRADAVLAQLRALRDGDTAPQQLWYLYVLEAWMQKRLAQSAALDTVYS
jgi:asparagine synthase (glutamine-hydrolysing)